MPINGDRSRFLLLSIRDEDEAADDEYRAVMRFGGLTPENLTRIRLTRRALGPVDLDEWSGIVLGGGPYNVSDPPESKSANQRATESDLRALLHRIVERDFPFLGCCYGVGTLGSVIGATIDRNHPEPVGAVTVELTPDGHDDPLFAGLPEIFDAYGGHKEAASSLPAGAVALATSDACPIQAFRVGSNVYATQFHPELDADGLSTRIDVYKDYGYFAPETAETLRSTALAYDVVHPMTIMKRFVDRCRSTS
jgi:GMP synthase (glutamine-hydrolysing)